MTVIYAVPTSEILAEHKVAIFYSVIINIITGGMIFFLILLLERKC